jgi:hypothetical protein
MVHQREIVARRRLGAVMFWPALLLVLATAVSCGRTVGGAEGEAPPRPGAAPDVGVVIRQVRFAFRPDGDGWSGGHATYASRVTARSIRVTPLAARRGAVVGAAFVAELAAVERGPWLLAAGPAGVTARSDASLDLDRGTVVEHLENTEDGVEQSFVFSERPAGRGDVTLRIAVSGEQYVGATAAGLHFADPATGTGVRYGAATWVDARGERTLVGAAFDRGAIALTVPEALVERSAYPAVLDPTIGPEIATDTPVYVLSTANFQQAPVVGFNGTDYLVVWSDARAASGEQALYATRVSQAGTVLDPSGIEVSAADVGPPPEQFFAAVASDGTDWLVTFMDDNVALQGARVLADGTTPDGGGFLIQAWALSPVVAWGGDSYLVAWHGVQNENELGDISAARVTPAGTVLDQGAGIPITTDGLNGNPSIAFNGESYLLAFLKQAPAYDVWAARVTPGGVVLDPNAFLVADAQTNIIATPAVASDGANWLVVWQQNSTALPGNGIFTVTGGRVDPTGGLLDPMGIALSAVGAGNRGPSLAAWDGAEYWTGWVAGWGSPAAAITVARMTSAGAVLDPGGFAIPTATIPNSPAITAGPSQQAMVAYSRYDPSYQTSRVREVILSNGSSTGASCATGADCTSCACADGVCCDTACTGTCMACTAAKKGAGADGTCGPVAAGADPDAACAAEAASTCGQDGACNGMGACELYAAGTACAPGSCSGATQTSASQCDGKGTCAPGSTTPCAPGYACVGGACATSCADDTSCIAGYTCDTTLGACVPLAIDGGAHGGAGGESAASTSGSGGAGGGGGSSAGSGGTASSSGTSSELVVRCGCRLPGGDPARAGAGLYALLALAAASRVRARRARS